MTQNQYKQIRKINFYTKLKNFFLSKKDIMQEQIDKELSEKKNEANKVVR